MRPKKTKGSLTIEKYAKPVPEVVNIKQMELSQALDYLDKLEPGIKNILLIYWEESEAFDNTGPGIKAFLPTEDSPLGIIRKFVLAEYPEWEDIYFIVKDEDFNE